MAAIESIETEKTYAGFAVVLVEQNRNVKYVSPYYRIGFSYDTTEEIRAKFKDFLQSKGFKGQISTNFSYPQKEFGRVDLPDDEKSRIIIRLIIQADKLYGEILGGNIQKKNAPYIIACMTYFTSSKYTDTFIVSSKFTDFCREVLGIESDAPKKMDIETIASKMVKKISSIESDVAFIKKELAKKPTGSSCSEFPTITSVDSLIGI